MSNEAVDTVDNAMSALEMSDDEVLNMDFDAFEEQVEESEPQAGDSEDDVPSTDDTDEVVEDDEDDLETDEEPTTETNEEVFDSEDEEDAEQDTDGETEAVDYEEEYKKLLAPFKANGKQMQANNVDEVRQLMQMGANYNKKMAALKPNLQMLKMLENNQLLDESKLSFLVDLNNKNLDAIKKLVKDSGLDLFDLDTDTDSDYRPTDYSVDDAELQLDEVLTELRESDNYSQVINLVTKEWDSASKQIVADNPQLLKVLDDQMATGIYAKVSNAVERERMFGRLQGLSDIEAYKQVGDDLEKKGAFNSLAGENKANSKVSPKTNAKSDDPKLKSKKRAASSAKSTKTAPKAIQQNVLGLSDEDFEKDIMSNFI